MDFHRNTIATSSNKRGEARQAAFGRLWSSKKQAKLP
jgi:hypothetical protein